MDSTFDKRERAYRRFNEILEVHNAAITAFRVLQAMPDAPDIVSATLRLKKGMRPAFPAREVQEAANSMLQTINDETERGSEVIRGSALVAVCSAFEHLVKATFVNQGEDNSHEATALLAKTKIRLSASEVLAMSRSEQWFAIADRLFEQLAEQQPNMHVRVRQFLLEYTYLSPDEGNRIKELLETFDREKFNEAFLVRNCLVHNGGRISARLAREIQQSIGASIVFGEGKLMPLLTPIRDLAKVLNPLLTAL